jgi:hypothetical protein
VYRYYVQEKISYILQDGDGIILNSRHGRGGAQHRGLVLHGNNSSATHNNSIVLSPGQRRFRQGLAAFLTAK